MEKRIDLHVHSTNSDGSLSVNEIKENALIQGVEVISITDHDTIKSCITAGTYERLDNLTLINGVELTVEDEFPFHILGYFFQVTDSMKKKITEIEDWRMTEIYLIIKKLKKLNISVSIEELINMYKSLSVKSLAKYLCYKGITNSEQMAYANYFDKGRPAYVKKQNITSKEAIQMIKEAKGIAVLAHPYKIKLEEAQFEHFLKKLVTEGLDGIELYHTNQSNIEYFKKYQKKYDLLGTGGSDIHSSHCELLGRAYQGEMIPFDLYYSLEKYL